MALYKVFTSGRILTIEAPTYKAVASYVGRHIPKRKGWTAETVQHSGKSNQWYLVVNNSRGTRVPNSGSCIVRVRDKSERVYTRVIHGVDAVVDRNGQKILNGGVRRV